jgi:hypothetical protein
MHRTLKCSKFFLPNILNELGVFYVRSQPFTDLPGTSRLLQDLVPLFYLVNVDSRCPFSVANYAYLVDIELWEF